MSTLRLLLLQQRGVGVLLFIYFLMNTGFFMLIPFVALHGTRDLGLSAAAAGLVLGLRQFIQQGLTIFGGALGDRIGYKPTLAMGVLVRAVGFAAFALATDLRGLLIAAVIAALGGSFFESTSKAALAALTPRRYHSEGFSLYGVASRLGSAIGPLIGLYLLQVDFAAVSLVASVFYVVCFIVLLLFLPNAKPLADDGAARRPTLRETLALALRDRRLVGFAVLNSGYWFLFTQFSITLPLYAFHAFGGLEAVSGYYFLNSVPAVFLQYPLIQRMSRRWSSAAIMLIGMSFIALGMGTLGVWSVWWLAVLSIGVYALGDLLYQPTQQTVIAEMARPSVLASYFGFASFGVAIGGGLGNLLGGVLFDLALSRGQAASVWYGYGVFGLVIALGLALWASKSAPNVIAAQERVL